MKTSFLAALIVLISASIAAPLEYILGMLLLNRVVFFFQRLTFHTDCKQYRGMIALYYFAQHVFEYHEKFVMPQRNVVAVSAYLGPFSVMGVASTHIEGPNKKAVRGSEHHLMRYEIG